MYAQKSFTFNNFKGPSSNTREISTASGTITKRFLMKSWERLCLNIFLTRRMKKLSRPNAFMLYGKLGVDFFSTLEILYPRMKNRLQLIRARSNFYMISYNPNVSFGKVDRSLYTHHIDLKYDHHKKTMDMLPYTPVEYNYLKNLSKMFIIPAIQNQFIQENIFNDASVRRIANAMITNFAFSRSYTENQCRYQQPSSHKLDYSKEVSQS